MKQRLLLIFCMFFSLVTSVFAGQATGLIETVEVGPGNGSAVLIKMVSGRAGAPACNANTNYDFAFKTDEAGGDATLSLVLAAHLAKQKVKIEGYAQCVRYNGVEDLRKIRFAP